MSQGQTARKETIQLCNKEVIDRFCKKCNAKMKLRKNGNRSKKWVCQPCHTKAVREKYRESRNRAVIKYRKTKNYDLNRKKSAIRICGVGSYTSVMSKRTEKDAYNARQRWTIRDDDVVSSRKFTDLQLVKMIGRTLRAIQSRKRKLKKELVKSNG